MTAWAYYNEFDPHAAEWLRNLIKNGLIAPGEVDGRDIREVQPDDLRGFTQCHFFAGIGVWSYSLRRAGWPDSRPVWTGSCPCQGFSSSGLQRGFDDERHLWPDWYRLIRAERPPVIFGEQVASALIVGRANYKAGEHGPYGLYGSDSETENPTAWLDLVQTDLERSVYAVGVQVTAAAGSGAPHIRQRLFFVGERLEHAASDGRDERWSEPSGGSLVSRRGFDRMGNGERSGLEGLTGHGDGDGRRSRETGSVATSGASGRVADNNLNGRDARITGDGRREESPRGQDRHVDDRRSASSSMADSDSGRGQGGDALCEPDYGVNGIEPSGMADSLSEGRNKRAGFETPQHGRTELGCRDNGPPNRLADAIGRQLPQQIGRPEGGDGDRPDRPHLERGTGRPGPTNGFWGDVDWLFCRDGKWRPVRPGTLPLVDGSTFRVDSGSPYEGKSRQELLKGAGNAIVSEVAIDFIETYVEASGRYIDADDEIVVCT